MASVRAYTASSTRAGRYPSLNEIVIEAVRHAASMRGLAALVCVATIAFASSTAAPTRVDEEPLCVIACATPSDERLDIVAAVQSLCGCAALEDADDTYETERVLATSRRRLQKKKGKSKSGGGDSNCGCAFGYTCLAAPPPPPSKNVERVCGVQFFFGEQRYAVPVVVDCEAEMRGMSGQPLTMAFDDYFVAKTGASVHFDGDVAFQSAVEFEPGTETVFAGGARFSGSPVIYKSGSIVTCDGGPMDVDTSKNKDGKRKVVVTIEDGALVDDRCMAMGPPAKDEKKSKKKKP